MTPATLRIGGNACYGNCVWHRLLALSTSWTLPNIVILNFLAFLYSTSVFFQPASSLAVLNAPSVPVYIQEPLPSYNLTVQENERGTDIVCAVRQLPGQHVKISWHYETNDLRTGWVGNLTKEQNLPLNWRQVIRDNEAGKLSILPYHQSILSPHDLFSSDNFNMPKYKFFCKAKAVASQFLTHSRKTVIKRITNLRKCNTIFTCYTGHLGGSVVCTVNTDPPRQDHFYITYHRKKDYGSVDQRLEFDERNPKYVIFTNGYEALHILNVTEDDTKYKYYAKIQSKTGYYTNTSTATQIRILDTSDSSQTTNFYVSAYEYRPGLAIFLPCYSIASQDYEWTKNDQTIHKTRSNPPQGKYFWINENTGDLKVRIHSVEDSGKYTCRLHGRRIVSIQVEIYKPLATNIRNNPVTVDYGGNATITCEISGTHISRVRWLRNGEELKNSQRIQLPDEVEMRRNRRGRLKISKVELEDQGSYQCLVERDLKLEHERRVPYDNAQSTAELIINKMPPILKSKSPASKYIEVHTNDIDKARGSMSCTFEAYPKPNFTFYLDDSVALLEGYNRHGQFVTRLIAEGKGFKAYIDYTINTALQTGKFVIEAENAYGSKRCEFIVFTSTNLLIRELKPTYYAVVNKPFSLTCHVVGGLNTKRNIPNRYHSERPISPLNTYTMEWKLTKAGTAPLTLPIDHRFKTDYPESPDTLKILDVQKGDSGKYSCKATKENSEPSVYGNSYERTTTVKVMSGPRVKPINNQLKMEKDHYITDSCQPINMPDGHWYAWWTFRQSGASVERELLPCHLAESMDCVKVVEYNDAAMYTIDSCQNYETSMFKSTLPAFLRNNHDAREQYKNKPVSLKIVPDKSHNFEGNFTCHIVSCYDMDSKTKEVTFKRAYKFQANKPPNQMDVILGASLYVDCALSQQGADDDVPSVSWYKGNSKSSEMRIVQSDKAKDDSRVVQFPNGTLYISEISRTDNKFLCATEENDGEMKSTTFNPNIHLPAIVKPFSKKLELKVGSTETIRCDYEGETPVTVRWLGQFEADDNKECEFSDRSTGYPIPGKRFCAEVMYSAFVDMKITVTDNQITFTDVHEKYKGRYTCQAYNKYNSELARLTGRPNISSESFEVTVIKKPGPVMNFFSSETTAKSISLQWAPPKDDGNKKRICYILTYKNVHGLPVNQTIGAEQKTVTLNDLQPGFNYNFQISAVNAVGEGPKWDLTITTKEREPTGPVQNLKIKAIGSSAIDVSWEPPELLKQNGKINYYRVLYRMKDSGDLDCQSSPASFHEAIACENTGAILGKREESTKFKEVQVCRVSKIDLKAFSEYQVKIIPKNTAGYGPGICSSVRTLESTPREPPMNVSCTTVSDQEITVAWVAPKVGSINGVIREYQVQMLPAEKALFQDEKDEKEFPTKKLTQVIPNLDIYANYSFTVTVANSKGRSVKSKRVYCKTQAGEPMPPQRIKIISANSTALAVSWLDPEKPNGKLVKFILEYYPTEANGSSKKKTVEIKKKNNSYYTLHVIKNLKAHRSYEVRIRSVNNKMAGEFSHPIVHTTMDNPPSKIASFGHRFLVHKGSDLTLDCLIFGNDKTALWTNQDSSTKVLPNGSLQIKNVKRDTSYQCETSDRSERIVYNVKLQVPNLAATPLAPQLQKGQSTNTSLEITWKPSGLGKQDPHVFIYDSKSAIKEYNLNYTNYYTGKTVSRTLSNNNRSFLVDPVPCGATVGFEIRAVNGHGLKSHFSEVLKMKTKGSAPIATRTELLFHGRYSDKVIFNFSTILPGDGCQPTKYFIYHKRSYVGQIFTYVNPPVVVHREDLQHGCCYNLTTSIQSGSNYQFTLIAHNAAGNATMNGTFYTLTYAGEKPMESRNYPGDDTNSLLKLEYIIPIVVVFIVLIVGGFAFILYYRRSNIRHEMESKKNISYQQHGPLDPQSFTEGPRKVSMMIRDGVPIQTKITDSRTLNQLLGPEKYEDEDIDDDRASVDSKGNIRAYATFDSTAQGSHPRDLETVREGRKRMQRNMKGPTHSRSRSTKRSVPYENDSTLSSDRRVSSLGDLSSINGGATTSSHKYSKGYSVAVPSYPRSPAERKEFRMARDYQAFSGHPPQQIPHHMHFDHRNSHMSSVTTLSSNHEELLAAYSFAQRHHQIPLNMAPTDYEENSGSSETTDPGIKQFTSRPPDPNELRNATCEVPLYHQKNDPPRLRTQVSVETDQTYESIDDMARSTLRSQLPRRDRTGTLPAPPRHGSFKRNNSRTISEAESYGTGVYESADLYSSNYAYATHTAAARSRKPPSSIYNSYRQNPRYGGAYRHYSAAERNALVNQRPQQVYSPPREDDEEVQSLLVQRQFRTLPSNRRPPPAEASLDAAAATVAADDDDEDEETYTDTFTVV